MLTIIGIGLIAGVLIGSVGIGGVIVAPALTYLVGFDIRTAIGAALIGFGFSGIVGTLRYQRHGAIEWSTARTLVLSALPAAVVGAYSVRVTPELMLKCILGAVVVASGFYGLVGSSKRETAISGALSSRQIGAIGFVTGYGSVITGTGGPLLLVPIMVWLQQPILWSIGLSQVIQLPISLSATATNIELLPDAATCIALAIALAVGSWGGSYIAHAVSQESLKRVVSYLLVAVGFGIVVDVSARMAF